MGEICGITQRSVILFGIYMAYLLFGGLMMSLLEYGHREDEIEDVVDQLEQDRTQLLSVFWAETIVKNEDDWIQMANERLDIYEEKLREAFGDGINLQDDLPSDAGGSLNPWNLMGSIFYCFTVVTTIGYGSFCPETVCGKTFTMLYGAIGIPFTLILMAELGKLFTLLVKRGLAKRYPDTDQSEDFTFGIIASVLITVIFLGVGSLAVWVIEDEWSLFDASYFSFITYSTIGFGDFIIDDDFYTLALMLYILTALSLCGMCFGVFQNAIDEWLATKQTTAQEWWAERRRQKAEKEE